MSAFEYPLHLLESYETYGSSFIDLEIWEPFVKRICQRHDLNPAEPIRTGIPGSYPTFIVSDRWVVKFFGQLYGGEKSYAVEWNANLLVANHAEIMAPAVLATGQLFEEESHWRWPYLIFDFVPGISIGEVDKHVLYSDKQKLANQLGQMTHKLHSLSLTKNPFFAEKGLENYANFLQAQRKICTQNHRKWSSLPERLIDQIENYLLPPEKIIDFERPTSLIHADITRDHILGQIKAGKWETHALIDFGDAMIGDIFYELSALHLDTFKCDRNLLKAFLEAYQLSNHQQRDFPRKAMSVALLHQFNVFFGLRPQIEATDSLATLADQIWDIDL